ncbi:MULTISPECIES: YbdD/YjiX family protein [Corynebacterium]|uniref:YbdD/YjiX family protein n=1 Tax=Corynebacterium TaxID=1716 RepID=UPI00254C0B6E|nr:MULTISPECIES: YbdD/YjiX family protein [Corynebacterium]MDK6260685.1 YbdD/YjiX family protein [Corynebacterium frankenforstense]MDK8896151.1 YbdD/YjiX family protein [Corynebacterium sp. MSK006]
MTRVWRATCSAVRSVGWYLGELMGDHDYAKYVAHLQAHHPDREVPTEKEYWRARWAAQDANPGARCC